MSLKVEYCGVKMRNPIIAASATPTIGPMNLRRLDKAGAGSAVIKSVVFPVSKPGEPIQRYGKNPRPRFAVINKAGTVYDPTLTAKDSYFTLFRYGERYPTPDEYAEGIRQLKKEIEMPIIASICAAPYKYDDWKKLCEIMQDAGSDAVELNMHCLPKIKGNMTDPGIVSAVKSVAKIPVIVKLMSDSEDPAEVGPKVVAAGADAITAIGTFGRPVLEIDAEKEEFFLQPTFGGMGGTWNRPVGLAWIARLARVVNVPLSGVSGVSDWRDVVKYILVGATTVQVCGALYAKGYGLIGEMTKGIEGYMERHGYGSLEDFRGKLLKDIKSEAQLPQDPPVKAAIDKAKCVGCGKCVDSCFFTAISMKSKKAVVDQNACDGCGICTWVCPVQAPKMARVG
ncbi:MAG: 4Fe-4S binding protein [Thermotogota bacterium]